MTKQKQAEVQPVETPVEEPKVELQKDVVETVGQGTFVLPDGTIKTTY
jgi:hypothetical protein